MAINTYSGLKLEGAEWLGRDLATHNVALSTCIYLATLALRRELRAKTIRDSLTLSTAADSIALPDDCQELRSIRYNESTRKYALKLTTPEALADLRRAGSGTPLYYAVVDNTLLFDITPDSAYTMEIVYYELLPHLGTAQEQNSVMEDNADLYLYGFLREAELYFEHDERNPLWEAKYYKALQDVNNARERAELGAAPTVMRLPVVFG